MNTIEITRQGVVSGSSDALVHAAADVLRAIPAQRAAVETRVANLVAAVSAPWGRIPVQTVPSAA
ncbi:MAG: hypothetical protein QOG53_2097 [Frankiales bacterium]|jgi:hypothetical protein|nr:hypothetical protein [Frankiales bacterium]